jgi:hypothetical protein
MQAHGDGHHFNARGGSALIDNTARGLHHRMIAVMFSPSPCVAGFKPESKQGGAQPE